MELHFCTVCGVSIPNVQVDSGVARGPAGELRCSDHRDGDIEATPDEPRTPLALDDSDLELLFCANCRVSVPMSDYRSGRARREYGSLLCGVCSKADPGTRAARREAVEAEMAADVEANDPVGPRRCSVCSAAVPQSHIVTGKALLDGQRVTCEACRAASSGRGGGGFGKIAALFVLVAAVAGSVGYVIGPMFLNNDDATKGLEARITSLQTSLDARIQETETASAVARADLAKQITAAKAGSGESLQQDLVAIRSDVATVRSELSREDQRTDQRLTRIEGQIDEIMKRLAERANQPPPTVVVRPPPPIETEPPKKDTDPPKTEPVVPQVNPEVVRLAKDLLESPDDSVRFPAANELGRLGDEAAIPALAHALVNDEHFLVRRACARSLNMLKAWNATPYLIDALEDKEAYVAQQANFALRNITGQDFEVTQEQSVSERKRRAKKARKWWDDNKETPPDGVSLHTATLAQ